MRTLLMLPLLLLPFTAQAASLLPGGDYPAPTAAPRCGLCPATARWTGGCTAPTWKPIASAWRRISPLPGKMRSVSANGWKKPCASTMKSRGICNSTIPPHANLTYGGPLRCGAINAERRSSFSEAPPHIRPTDSNLFDIYSEALRTALRHPSEAGEPIPRDALFRNRPPLCSKPTRRHTARSFP